MPNKYLMRDDAPIEHAVWEALDHAMVHVARSQLAGRRLLSIRGPYGLGLKAVPLGDREGEAGLIYSPVVPLHYIHRTFSVGARDLASHEREGTPLDTSAVAKVAMEVARAEDELLFHGAPNTPGLLNLNGAQHVQLSNWDQLGTAANDIIRAVTTLDEAGFHGPYTLALSPGLYNLLLRRYPQGNTLEIDHIRSMATDGVHKAPVLESGGVLVASGAQFASIVLGQDMTIGFIGPADHEIEFSLSESLALYVPVPQAICVLDAANGGGPQGG
ncbi:MAG: bacteriocin family protein [Chloroflexi bacterium]|nr:bacteriocin family protein [Chloroflexota bacterium]